MQTPQLQMSRRPTIPPEKAAPSLAHLGSPFDSTSGILTSAEMGIPGRTGAGRRSQHEVAVPEA
jgi:hypothetical protein